MRLAWLTDIHLNFLSSATLDHFVKQMADSQADAFVLTGDIGEANSLVGYLSVLDPTLPKPIYFVLGNHDFYGGSIRKVRQQIVELAARSRSLHYVTTSGVIELTDATCLVGHDGWADGRLGDFAGSGVLLNDFFLIDELTSDSSQPLLGPVKNKWLPAMHQLAQEAADHFDCYLPPALAKFEHIVVATHVPPFRQACWHEGAISSDDYLPFFASHVVGNVLRSHMGKHPGKQMTVLCGHTHSSGEAHILPNLVVLTGGAEYGSAVIQRIIDIA